MAFCDGDEKNEAPKFDFLNLKLPKLLKQKKFESDEEVRKIKNEALKDLQSSDDSTLREQIKELTKGLTE